MNMETNVENCLVCGIPVQVKEPGLPKAHPLCDITCMKIWCAQTDSELLSIEEYIDKE